MSVIDRFICRREGHRPAFTITDTSGVVFVTYMTTCLRCGKAIEVKL